MCILQSESAAACSDDEILIGSCDATTCLIVFVVCNYGVSVLHLDDGTCEDGDYLQKGIRFVDSEADLYMVGSYAGPSYHSKNVLSAALSFFEQCRATFNLVLAFVDAVNTQEKVVNGVAIPAPRITSACMNPVTRKIFPAEFLDHGPKYVERRMRCMLSAPNSDVYDFERRRFRFEPWPFSLSSHAVQRYRKYVELDDASLLGCTSTSPEVEKDEYADDMREMFQILIDNSSSDKLFGPRLEVAMYEWRNDGWAIVASGEMESSSTVSMQAA